MSDHAHAGAADAHADHHYVYEGVPANEPGPDEPATPGWVTLLGISLVLAVMLAFVATRSDGKTRAELTPTAAAAASAAPADKAPEAPVRPARPMPSGAPPGMLPSELMQRLGRGAARPGQPPGQAPGQFAVQPGSPSGAAPSPHRPAPPSPAR
jgi:hypothetical protein